MTPNALLPTILSFLPFTALLTVTLRNIFTAVPFWQVAASIAVQTACAVGAIWLAGRAFRLGMLRYGRRLRLRELLRARSP
jgi:ABC-2 type transport system permease protein